MATGPGPEGTRQGTETRLSGGLILLTARDAEKDETAAEALRDEGLEVSFEEPDVTDGGSVEACARRLSEAGMNIDVLVNNAGVYPTGGVFEVSEETFRGALEIKTVKPFRTCKAFVPGMVERGYGRVVNVSSGGGSFGEDPGPAAYAISKSALNVLTVKVSAAVRGGAKANATCPGWIRTDSGGALPGGGRRHPRVARHAPGGRPERRLLPRSQAHPLVTGSPVGGSGTVG